LFGRGNTESSLMILANVKYGNYEDIWHV